jgi:DNA-damage-inducible protein D
MARKLVKDIARGHVSPFEQIKRTNDAGNEYWSRRDFARILDYSDYRNFEQVIGKARTACFNSGQRIDDHFVDVTEMIGLPKGAKREVKTICLSR